MEPTQTRTAVLLSGVALLLVVTAVTFNRQSASRAVNVKPAVDARVESFARKLQTAQSIAVNELHIRTFKTCTDVSLQSQGIPANLPDYIAGCRVVKDNQNYRFDLVGKDGSSFTVISRIEP